MSEWKDLVGKINSAKLGNKYIEDSLKGLVYRYYNDGDEACDSRNDPYGYATKYFNALRDFIDDSEIYDIMYKPRIKYETKLKILIDYVCDTYGKNSTKESKKSAKNSIKESVEFSKEKDIYIAQIKDSSISFAYTPIDTDDDFNGYFVFDGDDVIEYLNWKGADANDMLKAFDDFEKAVKKYTSKGDAKIIIKDFHDKLGI